MFIHANIVHLAFNTLALVYLGGYAERSVGILRYIVIYILAGIAGALFYSVIAIFILGNSHTVLIGASGAISGILGIAACLLEIPSVLLAFISNCICFYWLDCCNFNSLYGAYWRFHGWPIAYESISCDRT